VCVIYVWYEVLFFCLLGFSLFSELLDVVSCLWTVEERSFFFNNMLSNIINKYVLVQLLF
jgi:hypothetical protein